MLGKVLRDPVLEKYLEIQLNFYWEILGDTGRSKLCWESTQRSSAGEIAKDPTGTGKVPRDPTGTGKVPEDPTVLMIIA